MKWILKIIEIQPYRVTCVWNDNIMRTIDLESFIMNASRNPANSYSQLIDKKRFSEVKCDGTSLYWDNGINITDIDGSRKTAALDIDPEVLFNMAVQTPLVRISKKREIAK